MAAAGAPRLMGVVNDQREPFVNVTVAGTRGRATLSCLVDTGFDGAVLIPERAVPALGLTPSQPTVVVLADGSAAVLDAFDAEVDWLRGRKVVHVLAVEANDAIMGAGLFGEHRLTVDYPARFVEIV